MTNVTVFTPTYNRSFLLRRLYNSLLLQTNNGFKWIIIDDGSIDDTEDVVNEFMDEKLIPIVYVKHLTNKGMLAAHNTAYSLVDTEIVMCVDSDDYMPEDGIDVILQNFRRINEDDDVAGIIGLDISHEDGAVIGDSFPANISRATFAELKFKYAVRGDKKFVYKMEVLKKYLPFPSYKNERFPAAGYLYRLVDKDFKLLLLNHPLCIVDYQSDGNTAMKVNQYFKSPNAFLDYRLLMLPLSYNLRERLQHSIHLGSSVLITGRYRDLFLQPYTIHKLISFPFSCLFYCYIYFKNKRFL